MRWLLLVPVAAVVAWLWRHAGLPVEPHEADDFELWDEQCDREVSE